MMRRYNGESLKSASISSYKARALMKTGQLTQARAALLSNLKLIKRLNGPNEFYSANIGSLSEVDMMEGKFEAAMKHIDEALLLLPDEPNESRCAILMSKAVCLGKLGRFSEAMPVYEFELAATRKLYGENHPNFGSSLTHTARAYALLKQFGRAVELQSQTVAIYKVSFGPNHPNTRLAKQWLDEYKQSQSDPAAAPKHMAPTKDRICSVDGCGQVKKSMNRCLKCLSFYLCKKHEKKINEHVAVCPKFPDVLPDEEKSKKIVKCRRCRKETKLMKCAVCESVWYCGAQCQKEDWKRHKQFCGKKK